MKKARNRISIHLLAGFMGVLLFISVAYAATRPSNGRQTPEQLGNAEQVTPSASPSASQPTQTASPGPAPELPDLQAAFESIENKFNVKLGLAVVPISPISQPTSEPFVLGTDGGKAWSTLDIVIALAVIRNNKQAEDVDYLLDRAITESSTAGDEALWSYLGNAETAAKATTDRLRDLGDTETNVVSASATFPSTPFADTQWSNSSQATAIAAMYCSDDAWPILSRMNNPGNVWGLATLPRTPTKSSSGQLSDGSLELRQLGLVMLADGNRVGAGVSAIAADGNRDNAKNAITELVPYLYQLTGFSGHC